MKEICLINKGENINKALYTTSLNNVQQINDIKYINGHKYITTKEGNDDIMVVRNYNPYYIKKTKERISILDEYANGFDVIGEHQAGEINIVVLKKPSGIKYSVKPLETIIDIANKFGVEVDYIVESNKLNTTKLFVGQILIV